MSEELQKWLSDRNFQISDKIDKTSNKNNKDLVSFKNQFIKTQEIKVFLSEQTVIEAILANNLITNDKTNAIKWFNDIKLRKEVLQKLSDLLTQSSKVLEFLETISTKSALKISKNRVQNFLKTLNYGIINQIYDNSNEYQFKSFDYSIIKVFCSQSFLLKAINEMIGCLISGIPIIVIAESESALFVSYIVDLCEKAGLQSGIINLVIIDNKTALKLSQTTEPLNSPIFVILESADIYSGIDRVISSLVNDTIDSLNVFVQQSVYGKFSDALKTRSKKTLEIGDRFDPNVDIISEINVNYNAIDFDNQNKSFDIQVFKFRTNAELKTLINHFVRIPYISLWAEKTSLALELAKTIDSTSILLINDSLKYPTKLETRVLHKILDKTELNLLFGQKSESVETIINSYKKWKALHSEERLRIIRRFLIESESKISIKASSLEAFNQKINEIKNNYGQQLIITDFEPIGLLALKIDSELNQSIFTLVLEALISGNVLLISCAKPTDDLVKLNRYLSSFKHNSLNLMIVSDQSKGNAILTVQGKSVGLYLEDLTNICRNSLIKLNKSITLSMGDISFAK